MSRSWHLMSSHGVVLFFIAANPDSTMREIAAALDLTERRVAQILSDLEEARIIAISRSGRRNAYAVNPEATFRHPTLSHIPLRDFQRLLSSSEVNKGP